MMNDNYRGEFNFEDEFEPTAPVIRSNDILDKPIAEFTLHELMQMQEEKKKEQTTLDQLTARMKDLQWETASGHRHYLVDMGETHLYNTYIMLKRRVEELNILFSDFPHLKEKKDIFAMNGKMPSEWLLVMRAEITRRRLEDNLVNVEEIDGNVELLSLLENAENELNRPLLEEKEEG